MGPTKSPIVVDSPTKTPTKSPIVVLTKLPTEKPTDSSEFSPIGYSYSNDNVHVDVKVEVNVVAKKPSDEDDDPEEHKTVWSTKLGSLSPSCLFSLFVVFPW